MYQIVLVKGDQHLIVQSGLNLDKAIEVRKKMKENLEDRFIVELLGKTEHMKICDDPSHIEELVKIIDRKDIETYYRHERSPVFILVIKFINQNYHEQVIRESKQKKTRSGYIEQARFYNIGDMDKFCAFYEPFIEKGMFLMKIVPLDYKRNTKVANINNFNLS